MNWYVSNMSHSIVGVLGSHSMEGMGISLDGVELGVVLGAEAEFVSCGGFDEVVDEGLGRNGNDVVL